MADLEGINIVETNLRSTGDPGVRSATNILAVHHSGHTTDVDWDANFLNDMHINSNGWSMIGYHFVIRKNGAIERGRPEGAIGAGVQGHNNDSIHIHVCGSFHIAEPTSSQIDSLTKLLSALCKKYSITPSRTTIRGHREFSGHESNECPGANLFNKLDDIVKNVAAGNVGSGGTPVGQSNKMSAEDIINKIYGPYAAKAAYASTMPQIPASTMIAMSIQYGGLDTAKFTAWNVFGIKYDSAISSGAQSGDLCTFNDYPDACAKFIKYVKNTEQMKEAVKALGDDKATLDQISEDSKKKFNELMLPEFAKANKLPDEAKYPDAVKELITKYNLYEWDKKEAKDKEPDAEAVAKANSSMQKTASNPTGAVQTVGVGFEIKNLGGDMVQITKLPKGKTNPCEPIYPDFITVSDVVPQWVLDATVEAVNAEAEKAKNPPKESAQTAMTEEEKKVTQAKVSEFEHELSEYKEGKYKEWVKTQSDLTLDNTNENIEKCEKAFKEAIKADKDGKLFYKDIFYNGDESIKKEIDSYMDKKKEIDELKKKLANQ